MYVESLFQEDRHQTGLLNVIPTILEHFLNTHLKSLEFSPLYQFHESFY